MPDSQAFRNFLLVQEIHHSLEMESDSCMTLSPPSPGLLERLHIRWQVDSIEVLEDDPIFLDDSFVGDVLEAVLIGWPGSSMNELCTAQSFV
mmetsp:Transcript_1707/g.2057  ORF Transcript_1707/g.2057 Transcript_1707/m.2057 type:complete len:92 (+) Transcript_1707:127-402(+)|eukprot:Skav209061  [mRNA]  locus=scaffold760:216798:217073:+ [translate_table: standard]